MEGLTETKRSKIHWILLILIVTLIGVYFWIYMRPTIVEAKCAEAANLSSAVYTRSNLATIEERENKSYDELLTECMVLAN